jgi:outer membrane protein OmpA-like peptidoglycan-associated protein
MYITYFKGVNEMSNKQNIGKLLISSLLFATVAFAESVKIESIGANIGYANMNYSLKGNLKDIDEPSKHFLNFEIYSTIKNVFKNRTIIPSLHYIYNGNNDIDTHTLLLGLNKCFAFENFNLYTGILAGYGTLLWKENPIKYTNNNDFSSNSLVGGLQLGAEFPVTKQLKFNLNLKYLLHDYKIDLKPLPNYSSELLHPATASISLGFKWFFAEAEERQKIKTEIIVAESIETETETEVTIIESSKFVAPGNDSDSDGIVNIFDRCENTPQGAIIDASGCTILDSDGDGVRDAIDQCRNTPRGFLVDSVGCKKIYTLNIKFAYKSNYINQNYIQEIKELAREINQSRAYDVIISSHTDSIGSKQYNLNLSRSRANAVYEKLVRYGVNKRRITIRNMGESSPIASNLSTKGREINRRIEITLIKKFQ